MTGIMHLILSSLGCPINRRAPKPTQSRSRVPDRLAKMFRARCLPLVSKTKVPQTEICGASFLAKSSNVDQRVWVTSTFLALYPLMVGNPILRPIPVLGLPRISLTSIPLPQSLFRTAQRSHCCPRATVCTTVHSTQFLRL